jgi:hypothetical protein
MTFETVRISFKPMNIGLGFIIQRNAGETLLISKQYKGKIK